MWSQDRELRHAPLLATGETQGGGFIGPVCVRAGAGCGGAHGPERLKVLLQDGVSDKGVVAPGYRKENVLPA